MSLLTTASMALGVLAMTLTGGIQQGPPPQGHGDGPPMRGPRRPPRAPIMGLLLSPAVRAELKLTDEQVEKIKALRPMRGDGPPPGGGPGFGGPGGGPGSGGPGGGPGGPGFGGPGGGPGGPGFGDPGDGPGFGGRGPGGERLDAQIKKILDGDQYRRFSQIRYQFEGAIALARPEVAHELHLSGSQLEQIHQILEQNRPPMPPRGGGPGGDGPGRPGPDRPDGPRGFGGPGIPPPPDPQIRPGRRSELDQKLLAVLTEEQRAHWKTMLGKPFHMRRD